MNKITPVYVMLAAGVALASPLVFKNQMITVLPEQLSVESVEFRAEAVVTETIYHWIETDLVTTNGMFDGESAVTNTVMQQVAEEVAVTHAAHWICNVIFELPKGHHWTLNGFPVTIDRFKTRLEIPVAVDTVRSVIGEAALGLEFAASNGAYQPSGQLREMFLSFAAAVLQAEIENSEEAE